MKVDTSEGSINVRTSGEPGGKPVLLLHPLSSTGEIWRPVAEWMGGRGFSTFAPDLPGGNALQNLDSLTVKMMADQAAAVIRALGLSDVGVVGMSMGGCIALQLTLDHPSLVGRLVLADTTSDYGEDRVEKWRARAESAMAPDRTVLLDFQQMRWFTEDFRQSKAEECDRVARIFLDVPGTIHAACCGALGGFSARDRIGEIKVPTLVLVGEADYATPPAMSEVLAQGIDGAKLHILPNVGHLAMVQSRDAWRLVHEHLS